MARKYRGKYGETKDSNRVTASRRKVLGLAGAGIVAATGLAGAGTVGARQKDRPDFKEWRAEVAKMYGQHEADIALSIVKEHYSRELSSDERFDAITADILAHSETPKGSEALRTFLALREDTGSNNDGGTNNEVGTTENTCDCGGSDGSYVIALDGKLTDTYKAYSGEAQARASYVDPYAETYAQTGIYGGGWAIAQVWGSYYVSANTTANVMGDVYRKVYVSGAECVISLGVRPSYGGWNWEPTETLLSSTAGNNSYSKTFDLDGPYWYDIGIQVKSQGSGASTQGKVADSFWGDRTVNNFTLSIKEF